MNIAILESMGKRFNATINEASNLVKTDPTLENINVALETFKRMRGHLKKAHVETGVDGFVELLELMEQNQKLIEIILIESETESVQEILESMIKGHRGLDGKR